MAQNGIIIIGAGGHAKVIIDIFHAMNQSVDYCVGDLESPNTCLNIPVLKGDEHLLSLQQQGYWKVFIAIGSNTARLHMAEKALKIGYQWVNAISPSAIISPSVTLKDGIALMPGVIINADSVIEELAIVNTGATIDHDCRIGKGAHIAPQCALAGNVVVGKMSFLGVGCKVIPHIQIGQETIVGAGSVVIRDLPDQVIAVGVPAKIMKSKQ